MCTASTRVSTSQRHEESLYSSSNIMASEVAQAADPEVGVAEIATTVIESRPVFQFRYVVMNQPRRTARWEIPVAFLLE